jgi:hypothetical protein
MQLGLFNSPQWCYTLTDTPSAPDVPVQKKITLRTRRSYTGYYPSLPS